MVSESRNGRKGIGRKRRREGKGRGEGEPEPEGGRSDQEQEKRARCVEKRGGKQGPRSRSNKMRTE